MSHKLHSTGWQLNASQAELMILSLQLSSSTVLPHPRKGHPPNPTYWTTTYTTLRSVVKCLLLREAFLEPLGPPWVLGLHAFRVLFIFLWNAGNSNDTLIWFCFMSAPPLDYGLLEATEGDQSPGCNLGNLRGLHFILSVNNKRLRGYRCVTGMLPVSHILNVYLRKTAVSPTVKWKQEKTSVLATEEGQIIFVPSSTFYPLLPKVLKFGNRKGIAMGLYTSVNDASCVGLVTPQVMGFSQQPSEGGLLSQQREARLTEKDTAPVKLIKARIWTQAIAELRLLLLSDIALPSRSGSGKPTEGWLTAEAILLLLHLPDQHPPYDSLFPQTLRYQS